jgi:glucuronosyltransferase
LNHIVEEAMPGLKSDIFEARKRISFIFLNKHSAFDDAVPQMPYVQYIGGLHLKETKPLPKDLETFVQGAGDAGFVYVSFGSRVDGEFIPAHVKAAFVEVFSKIPQRVIWKFKGTLPGLTSNVKLVNWAPQQDLLAHPKMRAFITHGGRYSIMEAIYHGVPLIGLPVGADQPLNVKKLQHQKLGIALSWDNVTVDNLIYAIDTAINDASYVTAVKKHQAIFKDNQVNPADVATYWIEYVARHDGAIHLRSAAEHLNVAQYFLLDVIALVALVLLIGAYVTLKVITSLLRICCGKGTTKKKRE